MTDPPLKSRVLEEEALLRPPSEALLLYLVQGRLLRGLLRPFPLAQLPIGYEATAKEYLDRMQVEAHQQLS